LVVKPPRDRQQAADIAGKPVSGTWPALAGKDWMTSSRAVQEWGAGHQHSPHSCFPLTFSKLARETCIRSLASLRRDTQNQDRFLLDVLHMFLSWAIIESRNFGRAICDLSVRCAIITCG
jgi:hypothetical protein